MSTDEINIRQFPLPSNQFIREVTIKRQIYLHHTVGAAYNSDGVAKYFNSTPERVATCIVLRNDGEALQLFSSKFWAYHLGLTNDVFKRCGKKFQWLDQISIGIEICDLGALIKKGGEFFSVYGGKVAKEEVYTYDKPFRGSLYFQRYTPQQIETLRRLLLYWREVWGIPLDYNEDIWDLCPRALGGEPGVFSHTSVRLDKSDPHPQPDLIQMLKSL